MSRRDELIKKNANIRSTAEISDAEVTDARQNHRPRSGQGSFAQRQRLEDRIKELEDKIGATDGNLIPLDKIAPNPWQPRRVFNEDELDKLAMSIQEVGLIQPILVRSVSNRDTIAPCFFVRKNRQVERCCVVSLPARKLSLFADSNGQVLFARRRVELLRQLPESRTYAGRREALT